MADFITPPDASPDETASAEYGLTQAHEEVIRLADQLHNYAKRVFVLKISSAEAQAIELGQALHHMAEAERAHGRLFGQHEEELLSAAYDKMRQHERRAYLDFERLSEGFESNTAPDRVEVAALSANIARQVRFAEAEHQAGIQAATLRKAT